MVTHELFILGKLMERPAQGFFLQSVLAAALGPFERVSWGDVEAVVERMKASGFVREDEIAKTDYSRKIYAITDAGRARFHALMKETGEYGAGHRDLFRVKVGCFGHVDAAARMFILEDYRGYLERMAMHATSCILSVNTWANMPEVERPNVLRAIDFGVAGTEAEIAWVDKQMETMDANARVEGRRKAPGCAPDEIPIRRHGLEFGAEAEIAAEA